MKPTFCFFTLVILVLSSGCKKEVNSSTNNNSNANIDSVITYLKSKIPNEIRKLDLESIKSLNYKGKSIAIQIFEKSSLKKFLLLKNFQILIWGIGRTYQIYQSLNLNITRGI